MKIPYLMMVGALLLAPVARAQEEDLSDFPEVEALYHSMTPEQQQEVRAQAVVKRQELELLSPAEQNLLYEQLAAVSGTLLIGDVDPAKLDISKSKSTGDIRADLNTYQARYDNGQISNSVVHPRD